MIKLSNVSKSFGEKLVIDGITLEMEASKTHIILGQSGCGKSTLLRMINGLITPTHGAIEIDGTTITPSNRQFLASKMGYVIQEGGLFPHLTAEENISLVARVRRTDKKIIQDRLDELRELMGLSSDLMTQYPKDLSGGQRQRIGLMRALFLNPDYLLLDEPLGALDPMIRAELQRELKNLFNTLGKTVLLVTHDINEAAFLGDTVTLLRGAKVEQHSVMSDLFHSPKTIYVEEFIAAQGSFVLPGSGA